MKSIKDDWNKASETYLSESGLKEDSEEWKYIKETQTSSQIVEVINATWAHYNNPSGRSPSEPVQFVTSTPSVKNAGFRAGVKRKFNKLIGKKESGKIFVRPAETEVQPAYIDHRLQLEQNLSGKPSTARKAIDVGLQLTDHIQTAAGSEKIKMMVNTVLKFSNQLQTLITISDLVISF